MFGGCGLGAAIAALEGTTDRPVVWATAQYLSFAKVDSVVDFDVTLAVHGGKTTQARAVGHVGGTEIITVNAALGKRSSPQEQRFTDPPLVQPPEACPPRERSSMVPDSLDTRLEQRWALPVGSDKPGLLARGRVGVWTRVIGLSDNSAATLAVLGDYIPMGIGFLQGGNTSSTSLDNTLRVMELHPTDWYLLDIAVDGVANGFGHGVIHIWTEAGELCAIGSQSCIVRERKDGRQRRVAD